MRRPEPRIAVYGPAYLDRVIRIDRPIANEPVDLGCEGQFEPASGDQLEIVCPDGASIIVTGLAGTTGLTGKLLAGRDVLQAGRSRVVQAIETLEDLGGMGAGYAAALGGRLVSAVAGDVDPVSARIRREVERFGIDHAPVVIDGCAVADSTFIVTSGPHGDKLPVGLRGCHAAMSIDHVAPGSFHAETVVVASLDNALMKAILDLHGHALRILAPSARNCRDRVFPLGWMAEQVDLLALNGAEWNALCDEDRAAFLGSGAILSITRGPEGAEISWLDEQGPRRFHFEPAFPRSRPPVDTNRAGEAFGAHLILSLLGFGWSAKSPRVTSYGIQAAARQAAAAAGLVIDLPRFGFPTGAHIRQALSNAAIP